MALFDVLLRCTNSAAIWGHTGHNRHLRPPEYDSRNSWKPGWVIFKQWWRCITPVSQPLNSGIANAPGNGSNVTEIGKHKHTCKSRSYTPSDG